MARLIATILFTVVSSLACAQSLLPKRSPCPRDIMNPERVWSPDCRSYFVNVGARLFGVSEVEVYSVTGEKTYVNSAVKEIRCDLAIESLGQFSIQFHHIEWVDSDRLRLHVGLLHYYRDISHPDYSYLVNAHTGQVLETTFPTHRNWNCSASYASGM